MVQSILGVQGLIHSILCSAASRRADCADGSSAAARPARSVPLRKAAFRVLRSGSIGLLLSGCLLLFAAPAPARSAPVQPAPRAGVHAQVAALPLGGAFQFLKPVAIAVDGASPANVYVADYANGAIFTFPANCTSSSCVSSFSTNYQMPPAGVAVDRCGQVYVTYQSNPATLSFYSSIWTQPGVWHNPSCPAGATEWLGLASRQTDALSGMALDANRNLYSVDMVYNPATTTSGAFFTEFVDLIEPNCAAGSSNCLLDIYTVGEVGGSTVPNQSIAIVQSTIPSGSFSGSVEFWVTAPSAGVKHVTCLADSSGDCQETVVPAYLSNPQGLATDTAGNAYVADTGNDAIKVIPRNCLSANCVVTLGGNFNAPQGVAIDASGNLYVADTGNKAIEVLTSPAAHSSAVDFGQLAVNAEEYDQDSVATVTFTFDLMGSLNAATPYEVVTQGIQNLDFTDAGGGTCQGGHTYNVGDRCTVKVRFRPLKPGLRSGAVVLNAASSGSLPATAAYGYVHGTGWAPLNTYPGSLPSQIPSLLPKGASYYYPSSMAVDAAGNLFFSTLQLSANSSIYEIPASGGSPIRLWTESSTVKNQQWSATGLTIDGAGNLFWIAQNCTNLNSATCNGETISNLYEAYASYGSQGVQYSAVSLTDPGCLAGTQPSTVYCPSAKAEGLAVDSEGNLFLADPGLNMILEYPASSGYQTGIPLGGNEFNFAAPASVAVDAEANVYFVQAPWQTAEGGQNDGNLYTISAASAYQTVTSQDLSSICPSAGGYLFSVATDRAGNLYAACTNGAIAQVPAGGGAALTLVSLGNEFYRGPVANIAVDDSGNLYIDEQDKMYTWGTGNFYVEGFLYKLPLATPTSSIAFSTTPPVNTASSPQNLALENIGNAPLDISSIAVSQGFAVAEGSGNCIEGQALAPLASCTIGLEFLPPYIGVMSTTISGTATVTDNSLNLPTSGFTVNLSGVDAYSSCSTAFAPAPSSQVFSGAGFGKTVTIQVDNSSASLCHIGPNYGVLASYNAALIVTGPNNYKATYGASPTNSYLNPNVITFTITGPSPTQPGIYTLAFSGTFQATNVNPYYTRYSGSLVPLSATVNVIGGDQFGSTAVGSQAESQVPVTIAKAGVLSSIQVLTQGMTNLDFTRSYAPDASSSCVVGHSYKVGDLCLVAVSFTPFYPGMRMGGVALADASGNLLGTAYLAGAGSGPEFTFLGAPATSPLQFSNSSTVSALTADSLGDIYLAQETSSGDGPPTVSIVEFPAGCAVSSCAVTVGTGGALSNTGGEGSPARPLALAVDGLGNVFAVNGTNAVIEVPANCAQTSCTPASIGTGFTQPVGIAVDAAGNLYIADLAANTIWQCASSNCVPTAVASSFKGFKFPNAVTVDGAGNLYVVDSNGIEQIPAKSPSSVTSLIPGNGFWGVAVDAAGDLYAGSGQTNSIVEYGPQGSLSGGPTTVISGLKAPQSLAIDGSGNLYLLDTRNLAEEIDLSAPPSFTFNATPVGSQSPALGTTLLNIGNANLHLASIVPSTGFALVSPVNTGGNAVVLAPTASYNLQAAFQPQSKGATTGSLTLNDDALAQSEGTQTIALSGITGTTSKTVLTWNQTTTPTVGARVTFTATVTPSSATGTVTFLEGNQPIGAAQPLNGGTAQLVTTALIGGQNLVFSAVYSGDTQVEASTGTMTANVNKAATTTVLSWDQKTPPIAGAQVTLTATVSPSAATGTVTFYEGSAQIDLPQSLNGGTAKLITTALTAASNIALKAVYSGDVSYLTSSGTITKTIKIPTSTRVTCAVIAGGTRVLSAFVTPSTATGSVKFLLNGSSIGTTTLSSGSASMSCPALPAGNDVLLADYLGDTTHGNSSGSETLSVSNTTTVLTWNQKTAPKAGANVTLTATLTPSRALGTVTFYEGSKVIGSATVQSGKATLATTALTAGTNVTLMAAYGGSLTCLPSTGKLTVTILAATKTSLSATPARLRPAVTPTPPGEPSPPAASETGSGQGRIQ